MRDIHRLKWTTLQNGVEQRTEPASQLSAPAFSRYIEMMNEPIPAVEHPEKPVAAGRFLKIGWAISALLLGTITCPIWMDTPGFATIPLISFVTLLPPGLIRGIDLLAVAAIAIAATGILILLSTQRRRRPIGERCLFGVSAISLMILFTTNQLRLQPWAWLLFLMAIVLANCSDRMALRLTGWLIISVYIHSAISKFDATFCQSLGQQFLEVVSDWIPVRVDAWSRVARQRSATIFPVAELLAGTGLMFRRTRRPALWLATLMHLLLCLLLYRLQHQPAVIVWNLAFVYLIWCLFPRATSSPIQDSPPECQAQPARYQRALAMTTVGLAVLLPFLEPVGWWDHWLSWGLYAPRNSRVDILVREDRVPTLPATVRPFVAPLRFEDPESLMGYARLRMDRWSLHSLHVPVYPHERYQLGLGLGLSRELPDDVLVIVQSMANRWTGTRQETILKGRDAMVEYAGRYRVNPFPSGTQPGIPND